MLFVCRLPSYMAINIQLFINLSFINTHPLPVPVSPLLPPAQKPLLFLKLDTYLTIGIFEGSGGLAALIALNWLIDIILMFSKVQEEGEDFKKRREAETEKIRRSNRDEIFSKRRNIITEEGNNNSGFDQENIKKDRILIVDDRFRNEIETFLRCNYTMDAFPEIIASINNPDILKQHYGIIGVRKILSIAECPPIQAVIDAGLVPKMIEYVKQQEYPQLQLEATWALTNVASGTTIQCQSIIDKGGIPLFVELLKSNNFGIVEQAIWAIGNISSDCIFYRDTIIRAGGLQNLVDVINRTKDETIVKHGCWALSNLCRGSPLPKYELVKTAIPLLCRSIANGLITDKQILADTCWAISYHSDSNKGKIQVVVDSKVIPRIINNLNESNMAILVPSIRILGNISTGSTQHTNELLAAGILNPLEKVLEHHKKVVRREACWVISNIVAGNRNQVEAVLQREGLLKRVLQLFETDGNDVRREIAYIFSNCAHAGEPNLIYKLYKETNIIRYYVNCLTAEDYKTVEVALECLFIVLAHGQKFKSNGVNPLVMDLRALSAVNILENLQYHKSDLVYENVSKILQTYFQIQDPLDL